MPKPLVGIDLAGAELSQAAPGTARMVTDQGRALLALDLPWQWVCVTAADRNPLTDALPRDGLAVCTGQKKASLHATFEAGAAWERSGCVAGFAPCGMAPMTRLPVLTTVFDSNLYEHGNTWVTSGRLFSYALMRLLTWHTIRISKTILVNSQYCKLVLARHFPRALGKMVVNHPGFPVLAEPMPRVPDWATTIDGKGFILNAGAVSDNKNQVRLVHAWGRLQAEIPDAPMLVLVGPCDAGYRASLLDPAIRSCPRPDEVLYAGRVSDEELSWAFHHCSGYVQPSIAEGFGSFSTMQAMNCGKPVACSGSTSHPEAVGDAAELFDPFDETDIARAAILIVKDSTRKAELVKKGGLRWKQFDWKKNAETVAVETEKLVSKAMER